MWNRYKDCEFADGEVPEEVKAEPIPAPVVKGPVFIETRAKAPREFYIKKEDAEKHGYTKGCGGCSSWYRGLGRQPHTEECRERFRELLKDEARVLNAQERKKDFEQKEVTKRMRKDERREKRKLEEDQFQFTASNVQQQPNTSSASSSSAPVVNIPSQAASTPASQPMVVNNAGEKRKAEEYPEGEESRISEVFEIVEEEVVKQWVCEIEQRVDHEDVKDDVHVEEEELQEQHENQLHEQHENLDQHEVNIARKEEIGYMQSRSIWSVKPISDCWEKTGKAPVSVRWVDVQKAEGVRSRLVARDFKGGDKDRDDLYAATPPLESKRLLISRAATGRKH